MDERIISFLERRLNKADASALLNDAAHDAELMRELQQADALEALALLHPAMADADEGRKGYGWLMKRVVHKRRRAVVLRLMRYAAVLLTGVAASWMVLERGHDNAAVAMQTLSVPAGQRARLVLDDGSSVWVNSGSTLRYAVGKGSERRVELTGEASFNVVHDAARPFIVKAGSTCVRVLGTRFNVSAYPQRELSVALLRGRVSISSVQNGADSLILKPGQRAVKHGERYVTEPLQGNPTLWTQGYLAFNDATMADIASRLETCYGVRIRIYNARLLKYTYTGKFRQADGATDILRLIQKARPFNMKKSPDGREIKIY